MYYRVHAHAHYMCDCKHVHEQTAGAPLQLWQLPAALSPVPATAAAAAAASLELLQLLSRRLALRQQLSLGVTHAAQRALLTLHRQIQALQLVTTRLQ